MKCREFWKSIIFRSVICGKPPTLECYYDALGKKIDKFLIPFVFIHLSFT